MGISQTMKHFFPHKVNVYLSQPWIRDNTYIIQNNAFLVVGAVEVFLITVDVYDMQYAYTYIIISGCCSGKLIKQRHTYAHP